MRRPNAKGFGVIHQGNMEVLTLHRLDLAIEHHRVFVSNISWGQYSYGCDLGWVLWADRFGVVSGQDRLATCQERSTPDTSG